MTETEGEILKKAIRSKYSSMEDAAKALGVVRKTLYNYFAQHELSKELREDIYTKLGIKTTQIVKYNSSPDSVIKEPDTPNYLQKRLDKKNSNDKTLEYYEVGAKASSKTEGEILPVSKSIGKLHLNELFKGSQYAIRVSGNSMTPNYPSGCIIGIRLIEDFMINPGSVYVIETGNDLWIKRLYYLNNDRSTETIVLMSDNKMKEESGERQGQYCYPSFTLHKSEVKNLFRVTGVFKSNMLTVIEN